MDCIVDQLRVLPHQLVFRPWPHLCLMSRILHSKHDLYLIPSLTQMHLLLLQIMHRLILRKDNPTNTSPLQQAILLGHLHHSVTPFYYALILEEFLAMSVFSVDPCIVHGLRRLLFFPSIVKQLSLIYN